MASELLNLRGMMLKVPEERQLSRMVQGELFVLNYLATHEKITHPKELSESMAVSSARIASLCLFYVGFHQHHRITHRRLQKIQTAHRTVLVDSKNLSYFREFVKSIRNKQKKDCLLHFWCATQKTGGDFSPPLS